MQRLGREIRRTLLALGLYLCALAFLAVTAFKFVPPLLDVVAATPLTWMEPAGTDAQRETTGSRVEASPVALGLHGSIAEPDGTRRREPHSLP
jgi:hypothetical protein